MNDDKVHLFDGLQSIMGDRHIQRQQQFNKDLIDRAFRTEKKSHKRRDYQEQLNRFIDKLIASGKGPDDPAEYAEWVRKCAESLISERCKAMDKYDTMESLK